MTVLQHFAPVLASYHEYWNGTGFPAGLKGKEIPLLSQIIHVCEHYDMLSGVLQGESQGAHQYAIDELEKGRDQLFSSDLLDIAIPVLQIWGPRDISWMRDIKNVHAFFTSDPLDGMLQEQREPVSVPASGEGLDSLFVPRQWEGAELGEDFVLLTGGDGLEDLTDIEGVKNFFDIIESSVAEKTREILVTLEDGKYHRENFVLANTPSSMVVHTGEVFFADCVEERFPLDKLLQDMGIHSCGACN